MITKGHTYLNKPAAFSWRHLRVKVFKSSLRLNFRICLPLYQFVIFNPWKVRWNWITFSQNSFVISPGLYYITWLDFTLDDLQTRPSRQILLFLRNNSLAVWKLQTDIFKQPPNLNLESICVYKQFWLAFVMLYNLCISLKDLCFPWWQLIVKKLMLIGISFLVKIFLCFVS